MEGRILVSKLTAGPWDSHGCKFMSSPHDLRASYHRFRWDGSNLNGTIGDTYQYPGELALIHNPLLKKYELNEDEELNHKRQIRLVFWEVYYHHMQTYALTMFSCQSGLLMKWNGHDKATEPGTVFRFSVKVWILVFILRLWRDSEPDPFPRV